MSNKKTEAVSIEAENTSIVKELIETNITRKLIPKGLSWFGCMGGLSLFAFIVQAVTGIFLVFHFIPSERDALASMQNIMHSVPYGWLIQRIHAVGPNIMLGMVFSHMLRILFKGIYRHPRELHWVSGACLLILTVFIYFTGTLLSVGNINKHSAMLTYLYATHVAGIPLIMGLFMGMHFFMVRTTGICEQL
ncbi:MAG: cytochrome b N-terminal domain-containing protein [Candidatus Brocadia sinica]|nr:cytochrome b N-terminal domain-containing protein [Candidatus Brocadia sinica]NUO05324.1 cytochrome b N-terminal domain-containing protein [Candidatus Brocadia sinica]